MPTLTDKIDVSCQLLLAEAFEAHKELLDVVVAAALTTLWVSWELVAFDYCY